MIRSMTGFGEAERDVEGGRLRMEIRSVNHRFFNPSVRLPNGLERMEPLVVSVLKAQVRRGHVTANLSFDWQPGSSALALPEVDVDRARHFAAVLENLRQELNLEGPLTLDSVARYGDVFRARSETKRPEVEDELLEALATDAVAALVRSREIEGEKLRHDLEGRLTAIEHLRATIAEHAPARLLAERDRLRGAIAELSGSPEVDEDRLAREIAYLAEKWDINEELVRLAAHVELFRSALDADSAEGVGRKLSFIIQEMNREANTVGSKANHPIIAHAGISLKEEIERLREQVENVE